MQRSCIILCGGGGKTTLAKQFPAIVADIDELVKRNENRRRLINYYFTQNNVSGISEVYRDAMLTDATIQNDSRIILLHRPGDAKILRRTILGIFRPSLTLHDRNISERSFYHQQLSRNDWERLSEYDTIEFDSYPINAVLDILSVKIPLREVDAELARIVCQVF